MYSTKISLSHQVKCNVTSNLMLAKKVSLPNVVYPCVPPSMVAQIPLPQQGSVPLTFPCPVQCALFFAIWLFVDI